MRIVPANPDSVICTVHLIKYYILISWTPGLSASVWGFCIFYFLCLGSFEGFSSHLQFLFILPPFCFYVLFFSLFAGTSHFILVVCSSVCLTSFILFLLISCTCLFTHLFPIPLISLCIFIATDVPLSVLLFVPCARCQSKALICCLRFMDSEVLESVSKPDKGLCFVYICFPVESAY